MKVDLTIDARGLSCPMPIVRAKKGMDQLKSGQVMKVQSTDKGSLQDFQAWVKRTNNELLDHNEEDGVYTYYVKKG